MAEETQRARGTSVRLYGREVVQTNREEAPTFYANNLLLQSTVWDVRLGFGMLSETTEDTITVRSVVNIMLSPQHAKAVSDILRKQIEHYEANYGRIPSDPRAAVIQEEGQE